MFQVNQERSEVMSRLQNLQSPLIKGQISQQIENIGALGLRKGSDVSKSTCQKCRIGDDPNACTRGSCHASACEGLDALCIEDCLLVGCAHTKRDNTQDRPGAEACNTKAPTSSKSEKSETECYAKP